MQSDRNSLKTGTFHELTTNERHVLNKKTFARHKYMWRVGVFKVKMRSLVEVSQKVSIFKQYLL